MAMSPRLLRPRATGFNPRAIPDLALWLDAADSSTITTSTGVSVWGDKSGNARNATQATGGKQPIYTNTRNGKNVITFQGTDDTLEIAANAAFNGTEHTIFFVAIHSAAANHRVYYKASATSGVNGYSVAFRDSGDVFMYQKNDGSAVTLTVSEANLSRNFAVYSVTLAPTSQQGHINGVSRASASATATYEDNTSVWIGSRRNIGEFFIGDIAEVLHFSRALSASERSRVERYLGRKWGVTVA